MKLMKVIIIFMIVYVTLHSCNLLGGEEAKRVRVTVKVIDFYPTQNQIPPARWRLKYLVNGVEYKSGIMCKWFRAKAVPNGSYIKINYNLKTKKYEPSCSDLVK